MLNSFQNLQQENGTLLTVKKWCLLTQIFNKVFGKVNRVRSSRDYSDSYILVTGNISAEGANNNSKVAFKNCAPFRIFRTEINDTFIDEA